ncbi:hypothetical protein G6L37_00455 [Agrobacterium rubi]|nr:hypothetical protein [Agrobacterium rubi]NTF23860.1 hypothetical protein [Agrobacterium rubi]
MNMADGTQMEASETLIDGYETALGELARLSRREEARRDLWSIIYDTLVTEFRFMRDEQPVELTLTKDGVLCDPFAAALIGRFLLDGTNSDTFLRVLTNDIRDHLSRGGVFESSWGAVVISGSDLVARLTATEVIVYERATKKAIDIDL